MDSASDVDPKNPSFFPIVKAVCGLGRSDDDEEDDEEMSGDENWLKALEKEKDKLWGSGLRATSIATFNLTTRYQLPTVVPDYNRNCKRS